MILSICFAICSCKLLIYSVSHELHLVLGFSNSGSFWLDLLSSQLLCWYLSVSCCLFLLLIPLTTLHFFHVLSHYPICYSKIVYSLQHLIFHYWYFLYHPSVDKLLIFGNHSVDLILVHFLLISFQLCRFCMELLFQLFYQSINVFIPFLRYTFFQVPHIFLSSLSLLLGYALIFLRVSWLYLSIF